MTNEVFEKFDEDIFDNLGQAVSIIWWLVHLLGDKVTFPSDESFWLENFPADGDSCLALRHEDGKLVMTAEKIGPSLH
jgi:hypothetical protein